MTDPASQADAASASTPDGDGPVRLSDRTAGGSPAANQGKTEPYPPTAGHQAPAGSSGPRPGGEAATGLPPAELAVDVGDPQAPSHPAASTRPFTHVASGPGPSARGVAQRARGQQGVAEEPIETDHAASAGAIRAAAPAALFSDAPDSAQTSASSRTPGDASSVPVASHDAAEGTSESMSTVQGARTPVE